MKIHEKVQIIKSIKKFICGKNDNLKERKEESHAR